MQAERVQHILRGGQHLLRLVEDILSVTSLESSQATLDVHDVPVAAAVVAAARQVAFMASSADIRIEIAAAEVELVVRGDAMRIEQVLVNLLTNAIKYNRAGGWVKVGGVAEGDLARVSVRDSGPGLTPMQMAQLFQPFNRLGAEYTRTDGTGLGLVIVRELTERMGGRVEVQSEPGVGSCFTLCLPLAAPAPAAAARAPPQTS
jgi:signal transduction histidine kinase